MNKKIYLASAILGLSALNAHAQYPIESDIVINEPADLSSIWGTENNIIIAGATVTMGADAFNICGLPSGEGSLITMTEGSKLVMFDSPDIWSPDLDAPENDELYDYLIDGESKPITRMPFNFEIAGSARIEADSKCRIGGYFSGAGDLTILISDSTVIDADFAGFTGKLILEKRSETSDVLFGNVFPGSAIDDDNGLQHLGNPSARQWKIMNWTLQVPDGTVLKTFDVFHIAFPKIIGKAKIECNATCTFRPNELWVFDVEIEGGGIVDENDLGKGRHLELYGEGTEFVNPIDYVGANCYIRRGGLYINSSPQIATFANLMGNISARPKEGAFVAGTGYIACGIDHNSTAVYLRPGRMGDNSLGVLTVERDIKHNSGNVISLDFGGNGDSDRLVCNSAIRFTALEGRFSFNLTDEFFANPKAGDYLLVDAKEYIQYIAEGEEEPSGILKLFCPQLDAYKTESGELDPTMDDLLAAKGLTGYSWNFDNLLTTGVVSLLGPDYVAGQPYVNDHMVGISNESVSTDIISRTYYSLNGMQLRLPQPGFNIIRTVYSNGTVDTQKVFMHN